MALSTTIAFTAGLVSFLSPCILPILPGFLAYLSGSGTKDEPSSRFDTFISTVFFVLGFSLVFSLLGVLLNTILSSVAYDTQIWAGRIGGLLMIFFGLYLTGLIKISWLDREYKIHPETKIPSRHLASFVFGAAFAAGWSPCVGAILGSILGLAATQPSSAFTLLLTYSLGLSLPFLLVGIFAQGAINLLRKFKNILRFASIFFGIILVIIGALSFMGQLGRIANFELLTKLF